MVTPETRRLDQTFLPPASAFLSGLGSVGEAAGGTAGAWSFVVESALLESSIQGLSAIPRGRADWPRFGYIGNTVDLKAEQNRSAEPAMLLQCSMAQILKRREAPPPYACPNLAW
jgi:hypothetical protein